jgi:hypothetical protein
VFIHVNEDSVDNELRRAQTYCKDCDAYAWIRLVERVRTVTAYWIIKSSERHHFLICDACQAQFPLKPHNKVDLEQADIHTLLGMSGGRHVPFFARAMVCFALIAVWMPVMNLLLVWAAWSNRAVLPPGWLKLVRYLFWAALAVNAAMLISMVLDHYFGGAPEY